MVSLGPVVARFNSPVTEQMEDAVHDAAAKRNVAVVETIQVPGAYDSPLATDRLACHDDIDAAVVIGAAVTGDTDHDRVIADATAKSLTEVSLDRGKPVSFGVSGLGMSGAEAREHVSKGAEAVYAATDMVEALAWTSISATEPAASNRARRSLSRTS